MCMHACISLWFWFRSVNSTFRDYETKKKLLKTRKILTRKLFSLLTRRTRKRCEEILGRHGLSYFFERLHSLALFSENKLVWKNFLWISTSNFKENLYNALENVKICIGKLLKFCKKFCLFRLRLENLFPSTFYIIYIQYC